MNYFLLVGIIPPDLYGGYICAMSLRCTLRFVVSDSGLCCVILAIGVPP